MQEVKIGGETYLDRYKSIDLHKSSTIGELRKISEDFFNACVYVQERIIEQSGDDFKGEFEHLKGELNMSIGPDLANILNELGYINDYGFDFIAFANNELFEDKCNVRYALSYTGQQEGLDQLFEILKSYTPRSRVSEIPDAGISELKRNINMLGNTISSNTTDYISIIIDLPDNIFLAKLIILLSSYRIQHGIDDSRADFEKALAA